MSTPPPHPPLINLDSPSPTDDFDRLFAVMHAPEVSKSPLSLLGGDLQLFKGVKVGLTPIAQELLCVVPEEDLFSSNIEFLCRCLIMTRLGVDTRGRKVEEIPPQA